MRSHDEKRKRQLGMTMGKANAMLLRSLLYQLAHATGRHVCHRCKTAIMKVDELSIEHKVPWQDSDNPTTLFFDLENVAFSHRACNYRAARRSNQKFFSAEERLERNRQINAASHRARYIPERRRAKYEQTGY